jgi:hypothetical protein
MLVEKCPADRNRRLVAGWRLNALLPGEAVGEALHRRRWWISSGVLANGSAKQGRSSGGGAFLELADDALGDIAHGVDRTDHLLLADNDIVEQITKVTLCTEGFSRFVTSTTTPIATGWSESCRVGLSPTGKSRLSTEHAACWSRPNNWERPRECDQARAAFQYEMWSLECMIYASIGTEAA